MTTTTAKCDGNGNGRFVVVSSSSDVCRKSASTTEARQRLDLIRYRDTPSFAARRHFPEAEWIPELVAVGLLGVGESYGPAAAAGWLLYLRLLLLLPRGRLPRSHLHAHALTTNHLETGFFFQMFYA